MIIFAIIPTYFTSFTISGMDFAFGRNGYVYHTRYDTESYIPAGSHQHLGDNILALLNSLGYAEEFYNMEVCQF